MLKLIFRTLSGWGLGRVVALVSPLQKFSWGLGVAFWTGTLLTALGVAMLWFYPHHWFAENIFDFFGGFVALLSGATAYAAFALKNFQDEKVEQLSDLGHEQFSKVLASAKSKLEKSSEASSDASKRKV